MTDLTKPEEWARFYRAKVGFGRANRWFNRHIVERELYDEMARALANESGSNLIEMGCANSDWLPYYSSTYGYAVYGIDYLESGCQLAMRKLEQSNCTDFKIFCGDFRELQNIVGRQFDFVVSFGVIEHFQDPGSLIEVFGRYLRDGGILITVCPNTAGYAMHLQKYVDSNVYEGHLRFSLDDLVEYHRLGGLVPERACYLGFLSLNNLDFSGYKTTGTLLKMLIKLANGPVVALFYLLKKIGLFAGNGRRLSAAMFVVARKPKSNAAIEQTA